MLAASNAAREYKPLIVSIAFLVLVILINAHLFTRSIFETTDYAANSLLVQKAKHLSLLTGHYSRFRFHHPGPAFLYLFAAGEFAFYDVMHLVPTPYNAQLLVTIIFNLAMFCACLIVFNRHVSLSAPLALLAITATTILVNLSGRHSMLISNWMPDVMLSCYLLLVISASSVLAGEIRDLPFVAASGMLLIHAHFAQFMFVSVIGGGTTTWLLIQKCRQKQLRLFVSQHKWPFAISGFIVFVLALPPLLEILLQHPNNLDALLGYLHKYGGGHNRVRTAFGYFVCFLLFVCSPEQVMPKGAAGILADAFARPSVIAYWLALCTAAILAVVLRRATLKSALPTFLRWLMGLVALSTMLFIYWGVRIMGGFYSFNGHFIYSLHLLLWFLVIASLQPLLQTGQIRILNALALVCILILGVAMPQGLRSVVDGDPNAIQAAKAVPSRPFGRVAIMFDADNWDAAIGMANSMARMGKRFCVTPEWGFLFSDENVCPDWERAEKLWVSSGATLCTRPCRSLYESASLSVRATPDN